MEQTLEDLGRAPAAVEARSALRAASFNCGGFDASKPDTKATRHFYLQYERSAIRKLSVKGYAAALETTWKTEITRFGWAAPPKDAVSNPPGGRYPVRIEYLGSAASTGS